MNVDYKKLLCLTFKLLNPFFSSDKDNSPPPFFLLNLKNSSFKSWKLFLLDRTHSSTVCLAINEFKRDVRRILGRTNIFM